MRGQQPTSIDALVPDDVTSSPDAPRADVTDDDTSADAWPDANDGGAGMDALLPDAGTDVPIGIDVPTTGDVVITPSRVSGVVPLAIFFDSAGTLCTGCDPFHDLDYAWDFGDPTAGTWSLSGMSRNQAFGPVAAHVFETPGTYVVQVAVYQNGVARGQQVTITATSGDVEWAGPKTTCISSTGDFADCPPTAVQIISSTSDSIQTNCDVIDHRCLLHRGETFTGSRIYLNETGPSMIGAYGTGARPVIVTADTILSFDSPTSDWRFSDLRFKGNATANSYAFGSRHKAQHVLFQRTENEPSTLTGVVSFGGSILNFNNEGLHDGLFFIDNAWSDTGFGSQSTLSIAGKRVAVLGNSMLNGEGGASLLSFTHVEKSVISHNEMARQSDSRAVLSIRSEDQNGTCTAGCGSPARDVVISDNIGRTRATYDFEFVSENATNQTPRGVNFLVERNYLTLSTTGTNSGPQMAITAHNTDGVTIRNNIVRMDGWLTYRGIESSGTKVRAYNNSCFVPTAATSNVSCVNNTANAADMLSAYNNLLFAPQATGSTLALRGTATAFGANIRVTANPFVVADPLNPLDFRLKVGAQAMDVGNSALYPRLDFQLTPRPQGGGVDLGAFEIVP